MDYGDEEDTRSEFNISEIDWGEEPSHSWEGGGNYEGQTWSDETDFEISLEKEP